MSLLDLGHACGFFSLLTEVGGPLIQRVVSVILFVDVESFCLGLQKGLAILAVHVIVTARSWSIIDFRLDLWWDLIATRIKTISLR